jgi:ABC-2 type transport system permease protein
VPVLHISETHLIAVHAPSSRAHHRRAQAPPPPAAKISASLDAEAFLDATPFNPDDGLRLLVGAAGGLAAFAAFLIGATAGGADWTARSMGMLLVWEPRRTRVFATRLGVLLTLSLGVAAAAIILATALGAGVVSLRGTWDGFGSDEWTSLLGYQVRLLPLVMLAAAAGFGLAMIARSTGFALGVAAGYLAVVESAAQIWRWGSQWLVQTNVGVVLSGSPQEWPVGKRAIEGLGADEFGYEAITVTITPVRALLTLFVIILVIDLLALVLYRRRDLS